jgi:RNA polymerase sigma factor (sigma-70 family)
MEMVEPDAVSAEAVVERADRLAALYDRHASAAFGFAYLVCGDRDLADDAVQEAFERVMSRLGGLRRPEAFSAYLQRTVLNVLRARARSDQRARRREEMHSTGLAVSNGEPVEIDPEGRLWAALQALPERQRAAVICQFWMDLSERETARVLRCRPGTVKSLRSRGLTSIREAMSDG